MTLVATLLTCLMVLATALLLAEWLVRRAGRDSED